MLFEYYAEKVANELVETARKRAAALERAGRLSAAVRREPAPRRLARAVRLVKRAASAVMG